MTDMMIKAEWVIGETVTELQMARENHDHLRNIAADGLNPEEAVAYLNEQDPPIPHEIWSRPKHRPQY